MSDAALIAARRLVRLNSRVASLMAPNQNKHCLSFQCVAYAGQICNDLPLRPSGKTRSKNSTMKFPVYVSPWQTCLPTPWNLPQEHQLPKKPEADLGKSTVVCHILPDLVPMSCSVHPYQSIKSLSDLEKWRLNKKTLSFLP